jgi:hypothetical protein
VIADAVKVQVYRKWLAKESRKWWKRGAKRLPRSHRRERWTRVGACAYNNLAGDQRTAAPSLRALCYQHHTPLGDIASSGVWIPLHPSEKPNGLPLAVVSSGSSKAYPLLFLAVSRQLAPGITPIITCVASSGNGSEFQSLLHQGSTSNQAHADCIGARTLGFNPFFIRAVLPTLEELP